MQMSQQNSITQMGEIENLKFSQQSHFPRSDRCIFNYISRDALPYIIKNSNVIA